MLKTLKLPSVFSVLIPTALLEARYNSKGRLGFTSLKHTECRKLKLETHCPRNIIFGNAVLHRLGTLCVLRGLRELRGHTEFSRTLRGDFSRTLRTFADFAEFAKFAKFMDFAKFVDFADFAKFADFADFAGFANIAQFADFANIANFADFAHIANFANFADFTVIATFANPEAPQVRF